MIPLFIDLTVRDFEVLLTMSASNVDLTLRSRARFPREPAHLHASVDHRHPSFEGDEPLDTTFLDLSFLGSTPSLQEH